jgi:phospholipid/cholesterol/gamma-HCH transport system substrate-binding protein
MKFRIRYADRLVGLFVILALFALVGALVMAGASQRWFARDYRFSTILSSAAAATPGTGIFMRGFQVGKIDRVSLDAGNRVVARFVVYDTYISQVRKNSLIEIVSSPIGLGTQILFHPGKSSEPMAEGSVIPEASSPEGQALIDAELVDLPKKDDTITRLLAGVNPLIENVGKTVVSLNRTLTEVNKALAGEGSTPVARIVGDAAGAVAGVNSFVGHADATVGNIGDEVSGLVGRMDQLADNLTTISANLSKMSAGLSDPTGLVPKLLDPKGSLKTLLDDDNKLYDGLSRSVADIERAVNGLAGVTNSINAEVPGISATILDIKATVKQAQDVLEGLKNNALIRGGVPQRSTQPAVFQSLREGLF